MDTIDFKVLNDLSLGVYAISTTFNSKFYGCICNSVMQITSNPISLVVSLNHDNETTKMLKNSKHAVISILPTTIDPSVIGTLGFMSSRDVDKFKSLKYELCNDIPYLVDSVSYIHVNVDKMIETNTHTLFIVNVDLTKNLHNEQVMTYEYYHKVRKGIAPKTAPTYNEIKEAISLDNNSTTLVENNKNIKSEVNNMKYKCLVCGQIIDSKDKCPVCGAEADKIVPYVEEEMTWADEHVIGVAQGVDEFVLNGLRDHFKGECTEVGMYLAMARQAFREGYPEVGVVLEQIAHEEAEHAARFQEMLGELISTSTFENLQKMLAGENGACKSKKEIATKAKQLNYDAIHDSVHEMAKDEARHGKALEALIKRYFK